MKDSDRAQIDRAIKDIQRGLEQIDIQAVLRAFQPVRSPRLINPHGITYNRRTHRAKISMGVVKDDDSKITWDSEAMQKGR